MHVQMKQVLDLRIYGENDRAAERRGPRTWRHKKLTFDRKTLMVKRRVCKLANARLTYPSQPIPMRKLRPTKNLRRVRYRRFFALTECCTEQHHHKLRKGYNLYQFRHSFLHERCCQLVEPRCCQTSPSRHRKLLHHDTVDSNRDRF